MANAQYTPWLNNLLTAANTRPDLDTDTIKFVLTDHAGGDGAPDTTNDNYYDDIDGSTINSLSTALGTKTVGTVGVGVFDGADLSPAWTAVSGASVESTSMLKDTGTPSTSDLIGYWDTATGLPLTPNGGDVNLSFNASGIIKI